MAFVPRSSFDALRAWLIEHILDTARWRDDKAEEYPEDGRNVVSAATLRDAADCLEALDEDELPASFHAIAALGELVVGAEWWDAFPWGPGASRAASRFGFAHATPAVTERELGHLLEDIYRGMLEDEAELVGDYSDKELQEPKRVELIKLLRKEGLLPSDLPRTEQRVLEVLIEIRDLLDERLPA